MKKLKKPYVITGIAVFVLLGVLYFTNCRKSTKISVTEAKIGNVVPIVSVYGEIKGASADLSPKAPGVISSIYVKEGSKVSKDQTLLVFDTYETARNDLDRIKELYENGFATKQQFEQARLAFDNSVLVSPIKGVVTLVANRVGETASMGMTVISIVDPDSAYAELQIDEADIGDVKVGQDVNIYADAYPNETFKGKLERVVQSAELKKVGGRIKIDEEDKVFRGKTMVDNPDYKLRIGMSINADIITQVKENVLLVSREAVYSKDGKNYVFTVKNKKVKEGVVELGLKDPVNVEITKGLRPGDVVATSMLDVLKSNSKVEVQK